MFPVDKIFVFVKIYLFEKGLPLFETKKRLFPVDIS